MILPRLRGRTGPRLVAVAAVLTAPAAAAFWATAPATASPENGQGARAVSAVPDGGTPQLARTGNIAEVVRQLVQCGRTIFAVGSFTKIEWHGAFYSRSNIFSFKAHPPFAVSSWNPRVNGVVNSIAFDRGDCAHAYIGGKFTAVHGAPAHNIAEVSTTSGALVATFAHDADGQVETLIGHGKHIVVGGFYTSIGGSAADPYMTSLNRVTGRDDGYLHLHISGNYQFPGAAPNATRVYNQQLSHNGRQDLVEGDFTSVGGHPRQQAFMLRLGATSATVTRWTSAEFDQHCVTDHPFYVRAGSWSPSDSTVYLVSTGFHPDGGPTSGRRTGLCDSAAAFPAAPETVRHIWINYTGCWSLYSTAADTTAVYIGGHEEYADNPDGCKTAGRGAVPAPGLGGLTPARGLALRNRARTAGLYSRSRGSGADDMLLTRSGLWIVSDNGVFAGGRFHASDMCGGKKGHAGICFLPYR